MADGDCCGNCLYARAAPASARIGDGRLSCCRTAPILNGPPYPPPSPPIWPFPQVLPDFWCGEHAPLVGHIKAPERN